MIKKYSSLMIVVFCISCSGYQNTNHTPLSKLNADNQNIFHKMKLRNVSVSIRERTIFPLYEVKDSKYLNSAEIEDIFRNKISEFNIFSNKKLVKKYCDLQINYDRMFMMFTNSVFMGSALNGYQINCYKGNVRILQKTDDKRYLPYLKFDEKVSRFADSVIFSYDKEDEICEVKKLANALNFNE